MLEVHSNLLSVFNNPLSYYLSLYALAFLLKLAASFLVALGCRFLTNKMSNLTFLCSKGNRSNQECMLLCAATSLREKTFPDVEPNSTLR